MTFICLISIIFITRKNTMFEVLFHKIYKEAVTSFVSFSLLSWKCIFAYFKKWKIDPLSSLFLLAKVEAQQQGATSGSFQ